jgi:hypothetical protein
MLQAAPAIRAVAVFEEIRAAFLCLVTPGEGRVDGWLRGAMVAKSGARIAPINAIMDTIDDAESGGSRYSVDGRRPDCHPRESGGPEAPPRRAAIGGVAAAVLDARVRGHDSASGHDRARLMAPCFR